MSAVLEAQQLRKSFRGGDGSILDILTGVDLSVYRSEVVAVVGASGTGKSTLLHLLGALDTPTSGEILLDGRPYSTLDEHERNELRNRKLGFVFQFHHLLREFTALENVMMPLLIRGIPERDARNRAEELLARVGLAGRMTHRPAQLSGGEQQRSAVARAMIGDPVVLLADEPTGNLDAMHSAQLHDLLLDLAHELETALIVVTHNRTLAERADRILRLESGRLHPVDAAGALP
jgi:lipoprotein-releasing system ATP-binding protein